MANAVDDTSSPKRDPCHLHSPDSQAQRAKQRNVNDEHDQDAEEKDLGDAKVVFLDEVGAGVNRTLLNTIGDAIVRLNKERGYTFCVIEHDMDFIGRLCDPVICMAEGKVLAQGTVAEVKNDERVIEAYLGTGLKNKLKEEAHV